MFFSNLKRRHRNIQTYQLSVCRFYPTILEVITAITVKMDDFCELLVINIIKSELKIFINNNQRKEDIISPKCLDIQMCC